MQSPSLRRRRAKAGFCGSDPVKRRHLVLLVAFALVVVACLLVARSSRRPERWWYPFIGSPFRAHYTTGPFAMTSNTREDNRVWTQLAGFNLSQSRLTYAMSRGAPRADVAWLFPRAEWADEPSLRLGGFSPNESEAPLSRALTRAGYPYDWISRRGLEHAVAADGGFRVGEAAYAGLVIDELPPSRPELLRNLVALARAGVPVIILGAMPTRAHGWADREARDARAAKFVAELDGLVVRLDSASAVPAALAKARVLPIAEPPGGEALAFRLNLRRIDGGHLLLLFNESEGEIEQTLRLHLPFDRVELLDPETGLTTPLASADGAVAVKIPGGRTRILHLPDGSVAVDGSEAQFDRASWQGPPMSMRPGIRWWWPGDAVEDEELRSELRSLHAAGFGFVELQTLTIGFTWDELRSYEETIYRVGTASYFGHLRAVFEEAEKLGMRVDLTMGSGWPMGGPFVDEHPEQQLLAASMDVEGPRELDASLPEAEEPWYATPSNLVIHDTIGSFDEATRLHAVVGGKVDASSSPPTLTELVDLSDKVSGGRIRWSVPEGEHRLFAFYQNASSHNLVASAFPGARQRSPVLDHLDPAGVAETIADLGEPWLEALAPHRPRAFFVDSFELIGELPWSDVFHAAFVEEAGYDPTAHLPLLFKKRGESKYVNVVVPPTPAYRSTGERAERVREDYEAVREHLFREAFVEPLSNWMASKGIALRLQAHGGFGDYLDTYQLADIPESEALFGGGRFEFLKLASSAAHVAGRRFVSSESFINLTFDFDALEIDDYYMLAGNAYAAGINLTVCHGYAYHFPLDGAQAPESANQGPAR